MASTGEAVSYAEFEGRSNRLAQLLRAQGLVHEDHYSVFMENNNRYLEACAAGERAGLYYTCINSFLTAEEVAYIIQNSESQVLITSVAKQEVALAAAASCPQLKLILVVDGDPNNLKRHLPGLRKALQHSDANRRRTIGYVMLYSSGTTGRPKGIIRPCRCSHR